MFSAVWPLAALVCLGHTIFRLRSNVLRLTRLSMRPVPEATSGIGLWHNLLLFEARACVLVNCLIVSVSTDQLDYFSCWSHSLWREEGDCEQGSVPMTSRFLIAVAAEHIVLGLVFLIDQGVPNMQVRMLPLPRRSRLPHLTPRSSLFPRAVDRRQRHAVHAPVRRRRPRAQGDARPPEALPRERPL